MAGNGRGWMAGVRSARWKDFPRDSRRGMTGKGVHWRTKYWGRMHNCGRGGIGDFHVVEHRTRTLRQFCQRENQRGDLRSDLPFDFSACCINRNLARREWTLAPPSPSPRPTKTPSPSNFPLTNALFGFILITTEYVRAKFAARELCRRWAWWKHRGWNRPGTARAVSLRNNCITNE